VGGAQADFLDIAPAAVDSPQFLGQHDALALPEGPVDNDEDASDDVLHRILGGEGHGQAEDAQRGNDSGDVDTELVGGCQYDDGPHCNTCDAEHEILESRVELCTVEQLPEVSLGYHDERSTEDDYKQ
jgi:hypothetical protein